MIRSAVQDCIAKMLPYIESADYAGYDPYDALNSPLIQRIGAKNKAIRIGATQFLRRCPVNLRPLLGIHQGHNPKGLGLFLQSYSSLYPVHHKEKYVGAINRLIHLLHETRSSGYAGSCWGYNFPWQSRLIYRPRYTPTIVNTSFIGHALIDAYEATGNAIAMDMATSAKDFILNDLPRRCEGDLFCFSYSPLEHDYVHNANALGASLVLRIARITDNRDLRDTACRGMGYTVSHQREDGAWCFAEGERSWVDSYHTGYVLESLRRFVNTNETGYPDWRANYERGVAYYAKNFFLEDGTPKHYDNRVYPIDIHSAAEGICFFSGEGPRFRPLTDRVVNWMLTNLWDRRGFFYYRRGRFSVTKISYMRWSQAWALRALVAYAVAVQAIEGYQHDH